MYVICVADMLHRDVGSMKERENVTLCLKAIERGEMGRAKKVFVHK
jgi:hypothetical protein